LTIRRSASRIFTRAAIAARTNGATMATVKDHNGIHPVQRPVLPFADLIQHRIVRGRA